WFYHDKVSDWVYTTFKNGWIANRIVFNWLTKIFLPKTKPPSNKARLLILNGYKSHYTIDFL
ncbi:uncharacterized protein K441DRAFT_539005, partial [Cenococcum geophilum 1.58]|uniref:uncharacterized protein n=1 Tax=Cenococcum geophilum 1.58 TaxID=794803 RepID=UPI00358E8C70